MEHPSVGEHCSVPECRALDFLPIICPGCSRHFCKDHYPYTTHSCPNPPSTRSPFLICPACSSQLPLAATESPSAVLSAHAESCTPKITGYVCSYPPCKVVDSTPIRCFSCRSHFCVDHRLESSHACASSSAGSASASSSAFRSKALSVALPEGSESLKPLVDKKGMVALNTDDGVSAPAPRALFGRGDDGLVSDADEQLLLVVPFTRKARLVGILFRGPGDGSAPRTVRLFANAPSMDFDDAEDALPDAEIILSERQSLGHDVVLLPQGPFLNLQSLTLFVVDNQAGSDVTVWDHIALYGFPK